MAIQKEKNDAKIVIPVPQSWKDYYEQKASDADAASLAAYMRTILKKDMEQNN